MTARERILAIRLLERQEKNPDYASRIGIRVDIVKKEHKTEECKNHCSSNSSIDK